MDPSPSWTASKYSMYKRPRLKTWLNVLSPCSWGCLSGSVKLEVNKLTDESPSLQTNMSATLSSQLLSAIRSDEGIANPCEEVTLQQQGYALLLQLGRNPHRNSHHSLDVSQHFDSEWDYGVDIKCCVLVGRCELEVLWLFVANLQL